jgi:hypothetical protein
VKIRKKQCKACPWKTSTVPEEDIPNGYCATKHANLKSTIAEPGDLSFLSGRAQHMMACHESNAETEQYPCVGWLVHQLGPGNNIGLRMQALGGRFNGLETVGEQHERFEDTLPRSER